MNILLTAATKLESELIINELGLLQVSDLLWKNNDTFVLITGVGMVNTALHLGRLLAQEKIDFAINYGIAGALDRNIPLGEVVEIESDSFYELGAESPEGFLTMQDLGFPIIQKDSYMLYDLPINPNISPLSVRKMKGITVNRIHGTGTSIDELRKKCTSIIETMENAAFVHAMWVFSIPYWSFRGISNYIEPRNKDSWNVRESVKNVQNFVLHALPFAKNFKQKTL